jgi:hypothetical protein
LSHDIHSDEEQFVSNGNNSAEALEQSGARDMQPAVLLVGADKGGVGKTTITRTILDYLAARNVLVRAFDTEHPRGTLKRFHPDITDVVDITSAPDQMRIIDTLATSEVKMNVIDVRAGLLATTLKAFTDIGFFQAADAGEFNFGLFHVLGPSVASLAEIADVLAYVRGKNYFLLKNFVNEASYFDWHPDIYQSYFSKLKDQVPMVTSPSSTNSPMSRSNSRACRFRPSSRTRMRGESPPTTPWCCAAMSELGSTRSARNTTAPARSTGRRWCVDGVAHRRRWCFNITS